MHGTPNAGQSARFQGDLGERSFLQFVQQFRVPIKKPKQICHRR
jgi:hypothetical protein